jgi:3-methyladenine DNA glycosylase AlkD
MAKARPKTAAPKAQTPATTGAAKSPADVKSQVKAIMAQLESLATPKIRAEMGPRYGVHADKAFGIAVGTLQKLAKETGKSHELAIALWDQKWYEARMLASFIDEPQLVTPKQMDEWCEDFDNWGICDTVCFKLFDQTPHAFSKIAKWTKRKEEFVRRGGFALLACVALHNKDADEDEFAKCLPMIEAAAEDERNFVKKGVNWALRALGYVHSPSVRQAALALAKKLARSENSTARWIGKDAVKSLEKVAIKNVGSKKP